MSQEMTEKAQIIVDEADRRVLREIQRDMDRSPDAIAEAAGLSVSSYRRRLARLRASGVVKRKVALVDPLAVGIEVVVLVTMKEEHSADYDRFARLAQRSPQITQCYSVTGEADIILHAHMPDMRSFERWLRETIIDDPAVKRCTSHVVYSRMKFDTATPV